MNRIYQVCRVCLNSDKNKYISLHETYKQSLLFEHINSITNIKIKSNDGFPDKICEICFDQLCSAVDFKDKCEHSNDRLTKHSIKEEVELVDNNQVVVKKEKEEIKANDVKFEESSHDDSFDCNYEYGNEDNLKILVRAEALDVPKSKGKLNLECHDCGNIFKSKCKLSVHWKKTHMQESLICSDCKRTFKSYRAYHMHRKKKTKSCLIATNKNISIEGVGRTRIFKCQECHYKTSKIKDMSAHLVIHSGERPYQCHLCPNTYTQHSSLQSHMEGAHKNYFVEITCHFCGKYIKGRRNVYRHMKSHTNNDITCTVCKKVMKKKSFYIHMKRHSGVRSFTCEKCASTFYTSAELCNHKRWVHNKSEKMFKCDLCDYKCAKSYNVKLHKSKHTDNNFPCTICGRFYLSIEKLNSHQKMHYDEKKYSCPQCDTKFYKQDSIRKHMKLKHSVILFKESKTVPVEVKTENFSVCQNDIADIKIETTPVGN